MALDVLDATVSRIIWSGPSKFIGSGIPFTILKLSGGQIAKGNMMKPRAGDRFRLWGEWRPQKGWDEPAFCFESHEEVIDQSTVGMVDYLIGHVPGIGVAKAHAIVDMLEADTLTILRTTPEELKGKVHGITDAHIEAIRKHFAGRQEHDPAAYAKLVDLFAGNRVPKSIIRRLLKDFGSDAPAIITKRPYLLLRYPRMGWKTVDSFATAVAKYSPDGIDRHKFAIAESLEGLSLAEGHTYGDRVDIELGSFDLLGGRPRDDAWTAAVQASLIIELTDDAMAPTGEYALPKLAEAEREIARGLAGLQEDARPLPCSFDGELLNGLNDGQRAALKLIEENGVCLLTGAPGVGKTWTITRAISALIAAGVRSIRIAAPTGKASKRAAECLALAVGGKTTDIPCTTIHRLLGPKPNDAEGVDVPSADAKVGRGRDEFGFTHNESDPIPVDFLVIDETSMVDVGLGSSLIRAIAPGTRVVFVGDHNQLPSVGPGSMLRDMMDAGLPTAILTEIQRNSGRIVRACHAIKDGIVPEPAQVQDLEAGDNWIHIELDDPAEIASKIVELHRSYRAFPDPVWDLQVVTPQKTRLPIACANLNRLLSTKLNTLGNALESTGSEAGDELLLGASEDAFESFRKGDKVIRTKNGLCDLMNEIAIDPATGQDTRTDWRWDDSAWSLSETDVVNGDMGTVLDIVQEQDNTFVVVKFRTPDRLCRLAYGECHLSQAYAVTCHKAQGSGFPFVIVPVHHSFYWDNKTQRGIFNREWIYTAVSRAERFLITVGQFSAIRAAVGRKTVHRRKTKLAELIREHPAERVHVSMADSIVEAESWL
jgi:exodeoxyribonuclease V alpha subunit